MRLHICGSRSGKYPQGAVGGPENGRICKFSKCVTLLFLRYHYVSIGPNESNQCFSGSPQSRAPFGS